MLAPNQPTAADLFRPRTTIDAEGTVEGYASLFGELDQARDMVMPGAFRETLRLRGLRRYWHSRPSHAAKLSRLLHHPAAVARERRDAGEAAAAGGVGGAGRPAHDACDQQAAADVAKHRRAAVAGAGTEACALAFGGGIDKTDLQRAGLSARDERSGARDAAAAAVARASRGRSRSR